MIFAPIAPLGSSAYILFARNSLPADDLNELISWLKANPDKASAGNPGSTAVKLVMAFFQKQTATKFAIVPYRGAAPAMQDLVAGQIDLVFANPPFLPLVRDGKVKAFAVTSATRLAVAPNIPTLAEMRLPALSPSPWYGLFVPALLVDLPPPDGRVAGAVVIECHGLLHARLRAALAGADRDLEFVSGHSSTRRARQREAGQEEAAGAIGEAADG
jgi:hypothetical protein